MGVMCSGVGQVVAGLGGGAPWAQVEPALEVPSPEFFSARVRKMSGAPLVVLDIFKVNVALLIVAPAGTDNRSNLSRPRRIQYTLGGSGPRGEVTELIRGPRGSASLRAAREVGRAWGGSCQHAMQPGTTDRVATPYASVVMSDLPSPIPAWYAPQSPTLPRPAAVRLGLAGPGAAGPARASHPCGGGAQRSHRQAGLGEFGSP